MTQEEKAKAYDEALEWARKAYNAIPPESYGARKIIEDAFPELAESEDERIRQELIQFLNNYSLGEKYLTPYTNEIERWHAYLEKQKEQKPAEWNEEDVRCLRFIKCNLEYLKREDKAYRSQDDQAELQKELNFISKVLTELAPPQPHWKPSEEQMDWLATAVRMSKDKPGIHPIIESLYNELSKL